MKHDDVYRGTVYDGRPRWRRWARAAGVLVALVLVVALVVVVGGVELGHALVEWSGG